MRTRPLGCMTFSAILAAVVTLLVIGGLVVLSGGAIFSPGDLNAEARTAAVGGVASHAELAGHCDACHVAAWSGQKMADKCAECHSAVREQFTSGTGLHGRLKTLSTDCLSCHTEHGGGSASLTLADPRVFPHETTGYVLTAHLAPRVQPGVTCRECHPASPAAYRPPDCLTCHQKRDSAFTDAHTKAYGTACRNCHDGKDTYGHDFKHTAFELTGKHATAECAGCHAGQTAIAAMQATPKDCASCHTKNDVHQGRLGADCASCHTTAGWDGAKIDHATTGFVLEGKHVTAECTTCHVNRQWSGLGTTCASCHQKDDAHQGRLGTDCASCHTPAGWDGATFDHAVTGFALTGKHATADCLGCHAGRKWTGIATDCVSCHQKDDAHDGGLGTACASCHKTSGWKDVTFDHAKTGFALTGSHTTAACASCHAGGRFAGTPTTCVACHQKDDAHSGGLGANCAACHTTTRWSDATFDHAKTRFPLTGAHASVVCTQCHVGGKFAGTSTACASCHQRPALHTPAFFSSVCSSCHTTKTWLPAKFDHAKTPYKLTGAHAGTTCLKCHHNVAYSQASTSCTSCHDKPASHTAAFGTNCATCHSTRAWSPATFDHAATGWKLTGAHTSLLCTKCHTGSSFTGLSTSCASCHGKPSSHLSYATTCSKCHTTSAWKPPHYTGTHTFPMTHQGAGGICWTCHTSSLTAYTCSKCHPNSVMNEHHAQVSGYSLTTCAKCHPTGTNN